MGRVGVLALQGAVAAHLEALARVGVSGCAVNGAASIAGCDGLVLPGGESTVQRTLIERFELGAALDALHARGVPILATCAGVVVAAERGWLDAAVRRNGYGTQLQSFVATPQRACDEGPVCGPAPFIRAPRLTHVGAAHVLATVDGEPVLLRQGALWAATFHPELTDDRALHRHVFAR